MCVLTNIMLLQSFRKIWRMDQMLWGKKFHFGHLGGIFYSFSISNSYSISRKTDLKFTNSIQIIIKSSKDVYFFTLIPVSLLFFLDALIPEEFFGYKFCVNSPSIFLLLENIIYHVLSCNFYQKSKLQEFC